MRNEGCCRLLLPSDPSPHRVACPTFSPPCYWVGVCEFMTAKAACLKHSLVSMPSLDDHVARVLRRRTEEQVFGINALLHVAFVQDTHTGRNRLMRQFPREAMRVILAIKEAVTLSCSRTAILKMASPQPARVCFVDEAPEAHGRRSRTEFPSARLATRSLGIADLNPAVTARTPRHDAILRNASSTS